MLGYVCVRPQKSLVLAVLEEELGGQDVGREHVLFDKLLGMHRRGLLVHNRMLSFLVKNEVEFVLLEYERAVAQPLLSAYLCQLVEIEYV